MGFDHQELCLKERNEEFRKKKGKKKGKLKNQEFLEDESFAYQKIYNGYELIQMFFVNGI